MRTAANYTHRAWRRAIVMQQKTQRPVQSEIAEQTRLALQAWIHKAHLHSEDCLFPSRLHASPHLSTLQYVAAGELRGDLCGSRFTREHRHSRCHPPQRACRAYEIRYRSVSDSRVLAQLKDYHGQLFELHKECAMRPHKACPLVLSSSLPIKLLLFRHPLAGTQLVKGTIENGETPGEAALRELTEESGINEAIIEIDLGCWNADHHDQLWSFHLCRAARNLPERWAHQTLDDHGHVFEFFWAPLDDLPYADCHPVFQRALAFICQRLKECGRWIG